MPPKTTVPVDSLDAASVKFILSALKSCTEFVPDWNAVAKEHEIKYAKNARPRFNTIVGKFGFKLEDKKIVKIDDATEGASTIVSKPRKTTTPTKTGKRKLAKPQSSNKKPKIEPEEDSDDDKLNHAKSESEDEAGEDTDGGAEMV